MRHSMQLMKQIEIYSEMKMIVKSRLQFISTGFFIQQICFSFSHREILYQQEQ